MTEATRNLLEQHFDTAFAAPEGIVRLRELILTLAMQGELVNQDPNNPPASELLKEIEAEKQQLTSSSSPRRRGSSKPLPPIKPEEVPYELPQGWEWVRLGDICSYIQRGKGPKYVEVSTHRVISQKCVRWYGLDLEPARYIDSASLEKYEPTRFLRVGDLLWNSTGTGTIGRACLVPQELEGVEIVADSHVTVVRPIEVRPVFLWRWIQSPTVQNLIEGSASGTTNQIELNTSTVINHLFPLPPLPEQHRIVARIDQLMARCDELEKLRKEREEKRLAIHAAAIKQLLDAPDGSAWDFIQQHFGELYTVKENVADLRKAILQLAVMGRLVPQDAGDPPASELLKEIEAEKQQLVKEGKIKKPKPLPPIKPEEVPYELPQGWEWVRLQDALDVRDGTHDSPKDAVGSDTYPLITSKNFSNGKIDFSNARMISAEDHSEISKRSKVERLDILFSMIGGNIGNQVIVQEDRDFSIKNVALFKYYGKDLTYPYFIKRFIEHLAVDLQLKAVGGAQPFVSLGFLRNIVIGLPSVNEQHRIVARIDQLMVLCDTLEQQIDAATHKQTKLLGAVMAQV
jgi:type I restriction enzyme S subunit